MDRVGQTEHRCPGSLLAELDSAIVICDCDCGGVDLGSKRPELRLSHPYFCSSVLRAEDKRADVVSVRSQPNPAIIAALICSCLTASATVIVSRLFHVLKSAELISDSGLLASKVYTTRDGGPSYQTILDDVVLSRPCLCICQGTSAIFQPYHPHDRHPWTH
jgi:hypothetical protein